MGKISDTSKYATVTPASNDLIIGTDVSDSNNTKTFTVGDIAGTDTYMEYFVINSSQLTSISNTSDFFILIAITNSSVSSGSLTHANNQITYTGEETRVFKFEATCSGTTSSNNVIHFAFAKNGATNPILSSEIIASSEQEAQADGTLVFPVTFQCLVSLSKNDFVRVYVKNSTGANAFTLNNINVIATAM